MARLSTPGWLIARDQVFFVANCRSSSLPPCTRIFLILWIAMSARQVFEWRKSASLLNTWDIVRKLLCLGPVIWLLHVYDDHLAPKFRRRPDIYELARRAKGESPLDAPIPLPRHRKRALSNPLPALESIHSMSYSIRRSRQRTDEQATSPFITKLPLEIRQIIYKEVLADGGNGSVMHILRKHGRLGYWRCRVPVQDALEFCDSQGRRCVEGWLSYKAKVWHADKAGRLDLITDDGLVPLLRTWRVM